MATRKTPAKTAAPAAQKAPRSGTPIPSVPASPPPQTTLQPDAPWPFPTRPKP
ncbi:hypothetical protein SAMN02745117_01706 [Lampropedia hyalina DSM 16112]|uniref:Uncharacterized protein n=1 Tax=Lampropedia hyalina DSM 16112 TaxID=1122156 RepID=A0A1M5AM49_9BURK|nr:hypothetical protein [Lampropedia hyalina]SHF31319.1 hypothetical protein SAMN02745117_01706 [Lampropedia hyalina DSM 16112]